MASNIRERNSISKKSGSNNFRWFKILIYFVAAFAIIQICQQWYSYNSLLKEVDAQREQLVNAQAEYDELLKEKQLLTNDSYIEMIAREKLGMVKLGEVLVSIAENGNVPTLNENIDENDILH